MLLTAAVLLPDLVALDHGLPFAATVALRPALTGAAALLVVLLAARRWRRRRRGRPVRRAGAVGLAGTAVTGTWPAVGPPVLGAPIDHVLTAGGPRARDVTVVDVPGSDHRALVVRLRL